MPHGMNLLDGYNRRTEANSDAHVRGDNRQYVADGVGGVGDQNYYE